MPGTPFNSPDRPHESRAITAASTPCGRTVDRPYSATADAAQPGAERPIDTGVTLKLRIGIPEVTLLGRRFRIPEIDVQAFDLFDQQEDCFSRSAKVVISVGIETRAPGAELLDLGLIQTIAQRSP